MANSINFFEGDYYFLSNFYPCTIEYMGELWPSTEHAFQAAKTLDPTDQLTIRMAGTPGLAKRLGRKVPLRADWEEIKDAVMIEVCTKKFSQPEFAVRLLATDPAVLIEGNTWGDRYWGVAGGRGQNKLGLILMSIREELKQQ